MKLLAAMCASALLLTACAGSSEVSGDRRVVGGVSLTFSVRPPRAEVGRPVRLTLRLTNTAGRAETLTFPTGQQYDFWITDGADEVWRWSADRSFTQAVTKRELGPQDSTSFAETWQADGPGTLVAHGVVRAQGYDRELDGELTVGD